VVRDADFPADIPLRRAARSPAMINDRLIAVIAIGICEPARAGISDSFEEIPRALLPRKQNPALKPLRFLGPSHVLIDYHSRMKNRLGDRSGFNSRGEWGRKRVVSSVSLPQSRPFGGRSRGSQTCARAFARIASSRGVV